MTTARDLSQHLNTLSGVGWELEMARRSGKAADINTWTITFNKIAHAAMEQIEAFAARSVAPPLATGEQNSFPFCAPEAPKWPHLKTSTPAAKTVPTRKKKKRHASVTKTGGFRLTKWMKEQFGAVKGKHYTLIRHPNSGTCVVRTLVITNHIQAARRIESAPAQVRELLKTAMDGHLRNFVLYRKTVGGLLCLHIDLVWDSF